MTSKRLDDLKAERETFLRHERRIIEERDEILKNVRAHLDQLDVEIVRLGGRAREIVAMRDDCALAPFFSVKDSRNLEEERVFSGSENSSQKKRGRPNKETVPSHVLVQEKVKTAPNDALVDNRPTKRRRRSNSEHSSSANAPTKGGTVGEPWTCDWCGERLAAGRKRCGKCRRWKGGVREIRWTRKSAGAGAGSAPASLGTAGGIGMKPMRAFDVYRNLPAAPFRTTGKGSRSEVQSIVEVMVSCVSAAARARPHKGLSRANAKASSGKPKGSGLTPIQRVVSTSSSDSGSTEPQREQDRLEKKDAANDGQRRLLQPAADATAQILMTLHLETEATCIAAATRETPHPNVADANEATANKAQKRASSIYC